jgi:cysteine desulfurase
MRRYLDHNAGTPLGEAARAALRSELDAVAGNPSSIHAAGRAARARLEGARREIAALVGAPSESVVLTSGGTEAIALGLHGLARSARATDPRRLRILVGGGEHPAVHGAAASLTGEGFVVGTLAIDEAGRVDPALALDDTVAVVAVQAANHETGVVQAIAEIAEAARAAGALLFCDAVQAAGKLPLTLRGLSALALSSAKLYGPAGAGALVLGANVDIEPISGGGHQERGRRPGTEPLAAIVGFGAAALESRTLLDAEASRQLGLRERLELGLGALGARMFGASVPRLCNTTMCGWQGVDGPLLLMALDLEGFEISTGAACTSGSPRPSEVLTAAGHAPAVARTAVRISLGRGNDDGDVDALLGVLPRVLDRIRGAR